MFLMVDTGDDRRLNFGEFTAALGALKRWGVEVADPAAEFAAMDANGGGEVLFDEFSHWALSMSLAYVEEEKEEAPVVPSLPIEQATYFSRGLPLKSDRATPRTPRAIVIEPVAPTPKTPYQQYLETMRRYKVAESNPPSLADTPMHSPPRTGERRGASNLTPRQ